MSLYSWTHVTDEKTEVHQEIKWITWELVKGKARLWTQKHFYSMAWVFLIVFYWHKINVLMTKYGVIKRMWPEVQLLSPDDLFSWLLINVAFPLMLFFPPLQLKQQKFLSSKEKKVLSGIFLSFPSSLKEWNAILCPRRFLSYSLTKSRWFSQVQTSYLVKCV